MEQPYCAQRISVSIHACIHMHAQGKCVFGSQEARSINPVMFPKCSVAWWLVWAFPTLGRVRHSSGWIISANKYSGSLKKSQTYKTVDITSFRAESIIAESHRASPIAETIRANGPNITLSSLLYIYPGASRDASLGNSVEIIKNKISMENTSHLTTVLCYCILPSTARPKQNSTLEIEGIRCFAQWHLRSEDTCQQKAFNPSLQAELPSSLHHL